MMLVSAKPPPNNSFQPTGVRQVCHRVNLPQCSCFLAAEFEL
jgi:hypothetical protein